MIEIGVIQVHVTYVREASLGSRLDGLTYGELKGMVPTVTNTKKLPDPRTIESTCKNNILVTASDEFTSLVLFDNGIYKYAEYGHATSFSVSECAAILFDSVKKGCNVYVEDTDSMPWFLPLVIVGSHRVDHNWNSEEDNRNRIHYGGDTNTLGAKNSRTDNEVQTSAADYQNTGRDYRWAVIHEARKKMTGREEQVFHCYYFRHMKEKEIARELNIAQATVSEELSRARAIVRVWAA